jgi:hypothetical protein
VSIGLAIVIARTMTAPADAQQVVGNRVRYEMTRTTVIFDDGALAPEKMAEFAMLADRGINDIDALLNDPARRVGTPPRVTFMVRDDGGISRSFRRTVILPADRVRRLSAPYLHETVHVLFPMKEDCLWLSEGFASYVQSYVAENVGGYDGYVFSWGGNRNIDNLARRTLGTENGQAALPYVGRYGQPDEIFEKRREVAQPLYVLSHSLVKFMVEKAGLEAVKALVQSPNIAGSAEGVTGRTIETWKGEWLAYLSASASRAVPASGTR